MRIVKAMAVYVCRCSLCFQAFGNVTAIRVPTKIDGTTRGYGFVEMLTRSEALAALVGPVKLFTLPNG